HNLPPLTSSITPHPSPKYKRRPAQNLASGSTSTGPSGGAITGSCWVSWENRVVHFLWHRCKSEM
ncbi:MAG: hypothetical protein ACKOJE_04830, partial [Bacteroidota bacterium]